MKQKIHIHDLLKDNESLRQQLAEAKRENEELRQRLHKFYTNTDHGITMQDRHFTSERDVVYDENFDHDAHLTVYGDFESAKQRWEYAKMICGALNELAALKASTENHIEDVRGMVDDFKRRAVEVVEKYYDRGFYGSVAIAESIKKLPLIGDK